MRRKTPQRTEKQKKQKQRNDERRRWIRNQVRLDGTISTKQIRKYTQDIGYQVSSNIIEGDIEHLNSLPEMFQMARDTKEGLRWINRSRADSLVGRESVAREEKQEIASVVASLILGLTEFECELVKQKLPEHDVFSRWQIKNVLKSSKVEFSEVTTKLTAYWRKNTRTVLCDGGSTNVAAMKAVVQIARFVQQLEGGFGPTRFRFVTNCLSVFEILRGLSAEHLKRVDAGIAAAPIQPYLLGGEFQPRSAVFYGDSAHYLLERIVGIDLAFVGILSLDENKSIATCASEGERRIKSAMLEKAAIPCLVGDDAKLQANLPQMYPFAKIEDADLLISDRAMEIGDRIGARSKRQENGMAPERRDLKLQYESSANPTGILTPKGLSDGG